MYTIFLVFFNINMYLITLIFKYDINVTFLKGNILFVGFPQVCLSSISIVFRFLEPASVF